MSASVPLGQLFSQRLVILDGGLGTTLEEDFNLDISNTSLWSAKAITEHSEALSGAHAAFAHAGADIVSTATYQCSFETFQAAGHTDEEASQTMRKAVDLVHSSVSGKAKVALSLGPFGASLSPAQEFDGCYPPPYGPQGYMKDAKPVNMYSTHETDLEAESIEALANFHLQRLRVFADDEESWKKIHIVSFETVPLVREITAIRLAIQRLYSQIPQQLWRPWWISTVWPDGRSPQRSSGDDDGTTTASDVFQAVFSQKAYSSASSEDALAIPSAIGINCTALGGVVSIAESFTQALKGHPEDPEMSEKPWLVLYPNGGDVYDIETQKWIAAKIKAGESWAEQMSKIVRSFSAKNSEIWGGFVVGGCCRTGPKDIEQLRALLGI